MLQALRDEIIVKSVFVKQEGSILIPDCGQEYKQYHGEVVGEVISVGKDYKYNLKPGDKIVFVRHEGKRIKFGGELYLVLKARWVMGKVNER